ncbi:polysaccharide export protein [Flavobacterium sp. LaA7.5]|nr:polysaccharide export protein [Flavobacterium salilacus subsp. altitudinum]
MLKRLLFCFTFFLLLTSCVSKKKIIYLQQDVNSQQASDTIKYESKLQPDDVLLITVTSDQPELASRYNLMYINMRSVEMRSTPNNDALISYLIDQNGEINFPGLGKIKLAGLTTIEAEMEIKDKLKDYLVNPGVVIRLLNYKVSVLGEVSRPGNQIISGQRITLFEALSGAGDMTIYGQRKNVTVIRHDNGVVTVNEVDITSSDFVNSPFYYLTHNDVVYVKPNKTKINSSAVGPNITVGISAISLLITIIAFATR